MSIHIFDPGGATADRDGLLQWINANKNGRMNGITVNGGRYTNPICFYYNSSSYFMQITAATSKDSMIIELGDFIGRYDYAARTNVTYDGNKYLFRKAMMCSNGILIQGSGINYANTGDSSTISLPDIGITFDKNGYPVVFYRKYYDTNYYRLPTTNNSWQFLGKDTRTLSSTVIAQPKYGAKRTCLSPVIPDGDEMENYCPYCWIATHTQLSTQGLNAVRINDVDYITTGGIYIKDENE